jgi:SAM-dependent methyltransferase
LRCPRCKSLLNDLKCSECSTEYTRSYNGAPILIDFTTSAIAPSNAEHEDAIKQQRSNLLRRIARPLMGLTNGSGINEGMRQFAEALPSKARILMIGGGERWDGLGELSALEPEIVNSDVYPADRTHVLTDAHQLAFADETFDAVIIQAVLEHLIDPPVAAEEIWRVLKPKGVVLADTPFMQPVHSGAYDFTRFSPVGQRALFRRFETLHIGVSAGPMSALRWSIEHALRSLFRTKYVAMLFRPLTIPLGWLDQFTTGYAHDACCGSYFVGRKSNRTATPKEIVGEYFGAQR